MKGQAASWRIARAAGLVTACVCAHAGGDVRAAGALASFKASEHVGRNWPHTLVTYEVAFAPGAAVTGRMRLVDDQGDEHPFQFSRTTAHPDGSMAAGSISFMAALAADGQYSYELRPEEPAAQLKALLAAVDTDALTLDNGRVAVRLPPPGRVTFASPVPFGGDHAAMRAQYGERTASGLALGPIRGIRLSDGRWTGGSHFWAAVPADAPKILGYTCDVTAEGPLFVEARVRYALDQDRFYQCTVRVLADDAAARIDEQFDMGGTGSAKAWQVAFTLSGGWQPDHALWWKTTTWSSVQSEQTPIPQLLQHYGLTHGGRQAGVTALNEEKTLGLEGWEPWGAYVAYLALVDSKALAAQTGVSVRADGLPQAGESADTPLDIPADGSRIPFLAVVPMHSGSWRGDGPLSGKYLTSGKGGAVTLHWPLSVDPFPTELTHTGEYDPDLPYSYGRRLWALVSGPLDTGYRSLGRLRNHEGYINLDDYKDWVLDWPEVEPVGYPRLLFGKAEAESVQARLEQHPLQAVVSRFLYFTKDESRQRELLKRLSAPYDYSGPAGFAKEVALPGYWQHFHKADMISGWIGTVDELLADESLPSGQRQRLRRDLAVLASALAEPDANPRGSMAHLGNPNMPMCRFFGLPLVAALIPDHPHAAHWLSVSSDYVRYLNARNIAPGGAWSELVTYHGAGASWLARGAAVLAQAGWLDPETARQAALPYRFLLNLLSPVDPRVKARMLPAWGHEGANASDSGWLAAVVAAAKADPELAKSLLWGWAQMGRFYKDDFDTHALVHLDALSDVKTNDAPQELASVWLPGMGAALRAHAGDPLETYLSYRQGYMVSHCDDNQGDFVLWSKGAPLVVMSLFSYPLHQHEPFIKMHKEFGWYSQLRVGEQTRNLGGWNPSSGVHAHAFSSSADYLRGAIAFGQNAWWTRQILFLKGKTAGGPNYFLFRDSAHEEGGDDLAQPRWWQIRTWGGAGRVARDDGGLVYTSEYGPKLAVRFLQPQIVSAETREVSRTEWAWGSAGMNWAAAGSPTVEVNTKNAGARFTETLAVTSFGPIASGQDIVALLYPQRADEALPGSEALADGVVKLVTEEGVDYVFLGRRPFSFRQGDLSFSGIAGAVRLYADEVHLILSEGPGEIGYRGRTLTSAVPAVEVVPVKGWQARTTTVPAGAQLPPFALDDGAAEVEQVAPGVKRQITQNGVAYAFDSAEAITFAQDGVVFNGRAGGIVVNTAEGTVRLVLTAGTRVGYQEAQAWGCDGPYDLTFHADGAFGRHAGLGRLLQISKPVGLTRMAELVLDGGQAWAPGTHRNTLVVPLMPGEHRFELRNLTQPPVFRKGRLWQDRE